LPAQCARDDKDGRGSVLVVNRADGRRLTSKVLTDKTAR